MSYGTILGQTPAVEPFDPKASNVQFDNSKGQGIVTSANVQGAIEQIVGKDKSQDSSISSLNSSVSSLRNLFDSYEVDGYATYEHNDRIPVDQTTRRYVNWTRMPSTSYPDLILIQVAPWSRNNYPFSASNEGTILLGPDLEKNIKNLAVSYPGMILYANSKLNYKRNSSNVDTKDPIAFTIMKGLSTPNYPQDGRQMRLNSRTYTNGEFTSTIGVDFCSGTPSETTHIYFGGFQWDRNNFSYQIYTQENTYDSFGLIVLTLNRKKS